MSFMLFIGPIIGVAVAIIAAVVIISVIAALLSHRKILTTKINKKFLQSDIFKYLLPGTFFLIFLFLWLYSALCYLYNLV